MNITKDLKKLLIGIFLCTLIAPANLIAGPPQGEITLSPTTLSFSSSNGTQFVSIVNTGIPWVVVSKPSWISVTPDNDYPDEPGCPPGACVRDIMVHCVANSGCPRSGIIQIGDKQIAVSQDGAVTLSPQSISFGACGGTQSVTSTCTLTVTSFPSWLTLSSTVVTATAGIDVTCIANNGSAKSGYIVFSNGMQYSVNQDEYIVYDTQIDGDADVCRDGTYTFVLLNTPILYMQVPGYSWTGPLGSDIETGQGTNTVDIKFDEHSGTVACVFDICGETQTISKQINVLPQLEISVTPNQSSVVSGDKVMLKASGAALNYTWTPSNTIEYLNADGSEVLASPLLTTTYLVTGHAEGICEGNTQVTVTVESNDNQNYVRTQTIEVEAINTIVEVELLTEEEKNESFKYIDGLGRPLQDVIKKGSPGKKDLVQYYEYDEFGREKKSFLPYPDINSSGSCKLNAKTSLENYYKGRFGDDFPFSETEFDNSPLNRVMKQGAPGADWQLDQHPIEFTYKTNEAGYVIHWIVNTAGECMNNGYYSANQLFASEMLDEDQNKTIEYKDKQGQVVLKEAYLDGTPLQTYYVYDDFGLLRYVLPPQCIKEIEDFHAGVIKRDDPTVVYVEEDLVLTEPEAGVNTYVIEEGYSLKLAPPYDYDPILLGEMDINTKETAILEFQSEQDILNALAYQYKYDARKRMTHKKLPGAEVIYMVYDKRDRLRLTQDGNLRENQEWSFTKYDVLNRPVITGIYYDSQSLSQDDMQNVLNGSGSFYEERIDKNIEFSPGSLHRYTNQTFPDNIEEEDVLVITYYDNYEIEYGYTYSYDVYSEYDFKNAENTKGLPTVVKTKVLGTTEYLTTVNFYDEKDRIIQVKVENILNGIDVLTTKYDFVGKVIQTRHDHSADEFDDHEIHQFNEYDHAGRLTKIEHQIGNNSGTRMPLAELEYNEMGELITKSFPEAFQDVNYDYNIRGWLTKINDPLNLGDDLFGMNLLYNQGISELSSSPKFNGNIAAMQWATPTNDISEKTADIQSYGFNYDDLNRLTKANYGEGLNYLQNTNSYNVSNIQYDYNGNIKFLERDGAGQSIDDLTYKYYGNQLMAVGDDVIDEENRNDFTDKSDGFNFQEYSYDDNGNMTSDDNKGITHIDYNLLNLPERIEAGANNYIKYIYSASGEKLIKEVYDNNNLISEKYYIGEIIYNETELEQILTDEGKAIPSSGSFAYQYYLKDHLGNNRVSFKGESGSAVMVQEDHYYPFGMRMNGLTAIRDSENKFLYNGKELQDDQIGGMKLDWYDYGARMYDPVLGRWHVQDRFAEKYLSLTPYQYGANNPVLYVDINGDTTFIDQQGYITRKDMDDDGNLVDNFVYMTNEDGSTTSLGELTKDVDANSWMNNLLSQNAEIADNLGLMGAVTFKNNVKKDGPWDFKNLDGHILGLAFSLETDTKFSFDGGTYRSEDLNNIHFGVAGKALGMPETILHWRAGVAEQGKWDYEAAQGNWVNPDRNNWGCTYGDHPTDYRMIDIGFSYWNKNKRTLLPATILPQMDRGNDGFNEGIIYGGH